MAHLTKLKQYDIKDSNIALLGSDIEKRVREHCGDKEAAWNHAGTSVGLQIWRIEKFTVVEWPADRYGSFYDGDSYIILNTYKKTPEAEALSYDLHFWLGQDTTQDEAGTAAFKTVELDDHLHGQPIEYREVQGFESERFLSYFPKFICLKGGVATGFHHVSQAPPLDLHNLYRITFTRAARSTLVIRQVAPEASSLIEGDVYVLDKGTAVWQFNAKASAGQERFKAAEFVQTLVSTRKGQCSLTVYDEGSSGSGVFLAEFGAGTTMQPEPVKARTSPLLFRLSDATGVVTFTQVQPVSRASLVSSDAFLLDHASNSVIYVWIGKGASLNERRLAPQYAQRYLHDKYHGQDTVAISIVKMVDGYEADAFVTALGA
ncbi:actin regulatory protein [Mycena floridula]|nr:actin regulatory protein [Mycena floridula]